VDWAHAYEQLATGSPLAIGAALIAVALSTRKSLTASMGRIGARVGRLEQGRVADKRDAELERIRRWQLEAFLISTGAELPPWPDTPEAVAAPVPAHALPDWRPR